jgi:hypothetical protein
VSEKERSKVKTPSIARKEEITESSFGGKTIEP